MLTLLHYLVELQETDIIFTAAWVMNEFSVSIIWHGLSEFWPSLSTKTQHQRLIVERCLHIVRSWWNHEACFAVTDDSSSYSKSKTYCSCHYCGCFVNSSEVWKRLICRCECMLRACGQWFFQYLLGLLQFTQMYVYALQVPPISPCFVFRSLSLFPSHILLFASFVMVTAEPWWKPVQSGLLQDVTSQHFTDWCEPSELKLNFIVEHVH